MSHNYIGHNCIGCEDARRARALCLLVCLWLNFHFGRATPCATSVSVTTVHFLWHACPLVASPPQERGDETNACRHCPCNAATYAMRLRMRCGRPCSMAARAVWPPWVVFCSADGEHRRCRWRALQQQRRLVNQAGGRHSGADLEAQGWTSRSHPTSPDPRTSDAISYPPSRRSRGYSLSQPVRVPSARTQDALANTCSEDAVAHARSQDAIPHAPRR